MNNFNLPLSQRPEKKEETKKVSLSEYKNKKLWSPDYQINLRSDLLGTERLLAMMGEVKGKKILDLGCGNGKISRRLAEKGAQVIGVDKTLELLEMAKKADKHRAHPVEYKQGDIRQLEKVQLPQEDFDVVVSSMVHLYLNDEELRANFQIIAKYLKKGGRFYYLNIHPCRILAEAEKDNYFQADNLRTESFFSKSGEEFRTTFYHHRLEWVMNALADAGLTIKKMAEPIATDDEVEKYSDIFRGSENRLPSYIIIESEK